MADSARVTWHHDVRREDGTPYPTRNRMEDAPEHGDIRAGRMTGDDLAARIGLTNIPAPNRTTE